MSITNKNNKEIYNIPGSGWQSPLWNWGSAMGTGHDCAMLCRSKYSTVSSRRELIDTLLHPLPLLGDNDVDARSLLLLVSDPRSSSSSSLCDCPSFEEIKLILGLVFQNGRWDGSDGGRPGGYGEVLEHMARAQRYEYVNGEDAQEVWDVNEVFVRDVHDRFPLICRREDDLKEMKDLMVGIANNGGGGGGNVKDVHAMDALDVARRKASGLVLKAMGFVEKGW